MASALTQAKSRSGKAKKKGASSSNGGHPWGVFFTVLGTVMLDFDADSCQSPSRAYLLDVTLPGKIMYTVEFRSNIQRFKYCSVGRVMEELASI